MKSSLLPILQQAFPTESVISYETTTKVVQANAEGHLVTVLFDNGDDDDNDDNINNNSNNGRCDNTARIKNNKSCFVKTVDANYYYDDSNSIYIRIVSSRNRRYTLVTIFVYIDNYGLLIYI